MTAEEAAAYITPDMQALIDELVANAPPLTEAQKALLASLFAVPEDEPGRITKAA